MLETRWHCCEVTTVSLLVSPDMLIDYDSVVAQLATRAEDLTDPTGLSLKPSIPKSYEHVNIK